MRSEGRLYVGAEIPGVSFLLGAAAHYEGVIVLVFSHICTTPQNYGATPQNYGTPEVSDRAPELQEV